MRALETYLPLVLYLVVYGFAYAITIYRQGPPMSRRDYLREIRRMEDHRNRETMRSDIRSDEAYDMAVAVRDGDQRKMDRVIAAKERRRRERENNRGRGQETETPSEILTPGGARLPRPRATG